MSVHADTSAHALRGSRVIAVLQDVLERLSALFAPSRTATEHRSWELAIVCALVVAGGLLRFWGLGSIGLHGDEETMAMPVMHILQDGVPRFPSGMFYGRAIAQLYLMAGSVALFGASEWALRLPSAICGTLLILLAWPLGRRFLRPAWNMAFVATVAFLPGLIEVSQTARMYIFLNASIAAYVVLLFRWERTGRVRDLAYAVLMLLVAIQFQTLAIFSAMLLFFPGLLRGEVRKTLHGALGFIVAVAGFVAVDRWTGSFYPHSMAVNDGAASLLTTRGGFMQAITWGALPLAAVLALGLALAFFATRPIAAKAPRRVAAALTFVGLALSALLSWHAGAVLLIAAAIVARRHSSGAASRFALVAACGLVLALIQAYLLHEAGIAPARKIIGAMTGLPSIWTFLQLATYSPFAAALAAAGCLAALWKMSVGKSIGDTWLFFALGLWAPLLALGFFSWYVAVRYTDFALLPLLICACVSLQALLEGVRLGSVRSHAPVATSIAVTLGGLLMINPLTFARTYDAGYADHPDHKGAAEFVRHIGVGPRDIVVAEDVLQQKYYLGRVDYWLLGKNNALEYCEDRDGEIRDFYTGAKLLGTGADLEALVASPDRGAIYVIGSGEEQADGRRYARSFGIFEALQLPEFKVVYEGRDGLTKVWKVDAPARVAGPDAVRR